jgi:hypothetical protein
MNSVTTVTNGTKVTTVTNGTKVTTVTNGTKVTTVTNGTKVTTVTKVTRVYKVDGCQGDRGNCIVLVLPRKHCLPLSGTESSLLMIC